MTRLRRNFLKGTITGVTDSATTATSAAFASVPQIIDGAGNYMAVVLDPDGLAGAPEIVHITAHDTSATTATLLRAQEGTVARAHAADTIWRNNITVFDLDDTDELGLTAYINNTDGDPGRTIHVGEEEPVDPEEGDVWLDNSNLAAFPPSGSAGGDLDGNYPNPIIPGFDHPLDPDGVGYRPAALLPVVEGLTAATPAAPYEIVVLGDSISATTSPTYTGHRPWPWLLEQALTNQVLADGARYAKADTGHLSMDSTTGATPSTDVGAADFASEMEDTESTTHAGVIGSTMRVFWTRQPTGGDLVVRETNSGGTILATIDTNGTQKSSMFTDVDLPVGFLFAPGTIWIGATCAGGETSILEMIHTSYGPSVRIYPAVRAGYTSATYNTTPAVGLDLVENVDPDLTIIMTGTNDAVDNIDTRIRALISAVQTRTTGEVMVVCPAVSITFTAEEVPIIKEAAEDYGCIYVDSNVFTYTTGDFLHPDRFGHITIAKFLATIMTGDPFGSILRLTNAIDRAIDQHVKDIPVVKTADYTFVPSDVGKLIVHNSASAHNFTINQQATTAWLDGASFRIVNQSTGAANIVGAGSAVVTGITALGPYEEVTVRRLASNVWLSTEAGNSDIDVQAFTSTGDGTWTKPVWAKATSKVEMYLHGGGGGGGGGRRDATSTLRFGGGGGGSGGTTYGDFAAAVLPATLVVTVGAGGTAGTAAGTTANGGTGGTGGSSRVGLTNSSSTALLVASGGTGGGGGTNAAGAAGAGGNGTFNGGAGAAAGAAGAAGVNGPGTNRSGGGGSGGGVTAANATSGGGIGNAVLSRASTTGAPGGAAGVNGTNGVVAPYDGYFADQTGGGGGGSSNTTTSGNGGNGGIGSGGGGGGAGLNGQTGGAGGTGGNGRVVIVTTR